MNLFQKMPALAGAFLLQRGPQHPNKAQVHASYNKLDKVPGHAVKAAGLRLSDPAHSQFQTYKDRVAPVKL